MCVGKLGVGPFSAIPKNHFIICIKGILNKNSDRKIWEKIEKSAHVRMLAYICSVVVVNYSPVLHDLDSVVSWLPKWLRLCNLSVMPWIFSTKLWRGSDDTVGGTSIILFIFGMDPTGAAITTIQKKEGKRENGCVQETKCKSMENGSIHVCLCNMWTSWVRKCVLCTLCVQFVVMLWASEDKKFDTRTGMQ